MKVTFPHLGSMHIFCKAIAETAGIPYIVPPETSRKTLTLGVLHSNECICLPFKMILGNFIEALQMGADTIKWWPAGAISANAIDNMADSQWQIANGNSSWMLVR
jgi:2-keto-3-deoxy-6-phosphogluconate aldolase